MARAWVVVFCLAAVACGATATAPAEAPSQCTGAADCKASTPSPPAKGDGPLRCVNAPDDDHSWDVEAARRFDSELPKLGACTKTLAHPGNLELSLDFQPDGSVAKLLVSRSSVTDCEVVTCVSQTLQGFTASRPPPGRLNHLSPTLALERSAPPRVLEKPTWNEGDDNRRCLPPAPAGVDPNARGRLPPEQIQKIVRDSYGTLRRCYETGLGHNPQLKGMVQIRFVIDLGGHVASARVEKTTLSDCQVTACVRDEFTKLVFPEPAGGIVTVVYPIVLEPG